MGIKGSHPQKAPSYGLPPRPRPWLQLQRWAKATYWVPPMEVSRESGAASHTSSHPTFPSALLVVQCPDKRVWPFGTFHWRPYLRLALKYTFPRARPKPANVGTDGPYPFTVWCPVPTTGPVWRSLQAATAPPNSK